jgi:hypothetical protein
MLQGKDQQMTDERLDEEARRRQGDTGPLMPGQWVKPPKKRHVPTLEQRIWAAVEGKGIRQAIEAIPHAVLKLRISDVEIMLDHLEAQIRDRQDLQMALIRKLGAIARAENAND